MKHQPIETQNAPQAIGPYSQAMEASGTVYLSGQIPLTPDGKLITEDKAAAIHQVFVNLSAVANAAGANLEHVVKLQIYLTDMNDFALVNEIMAEYFHPPYPARACVQVAALPKGTFVEVDGILVL